MLGVLFVSYPMELRKPDIAVVETRVLEVTIKCT